MGAGKIFCILGGIITLVATFLFSFASAGTIYYYYLGLFMNIVDIFELEMIWIIMAIVFLIIMISGILILLGLKSRAVCIIGSIFAIVLPIYFILTLYDIIPLDIGQYIGVLADEALVDNIIPFDVPLGGSIGIDVSLGTYLMLGGGVLGLIGGIMGTSDF